MKNVEDKAIVLYDDLADMYFEDEDGEPCEYLYNLAEEDFETTFGNMEGEFVVCGTIGLWDGKREGYSTKLYNSIEEAIIGCNDGFYGNLCVTDEDGALLVDVSHHDGSNSFEIRELTAVGSEMWNNYADVGDILAVKDATCKVHFAKRKRLSELDATIKYSKYRIETTDNPEDKKIWQGYLENALEERKSMEEQEV